MFYCFSAESLQVEGSLGGLQLLDLTPEGLRHQKVFSVGQDPLMDASSSFSNSYVRVPAPEMYKTAAESVFNEFTTDNKALTFTLSRPLQESRSHSPTMPGFGYGGERSVEDVLDLTLRMASMCYTHSPRFLKELSLCADEFKDYMSRVATSIKHAAAEVAKGLVHKKSDLLTTSFYGSSLSIDSPLPSRRHYSVNEGTDDNALDQNEAEETSPFKFNIDAVLQTPVIVVPRTPKSSEVLVAHLGKISLHNDVNKSTSTSYHHQHNVPNNYQRSDPKDRLYLEIRDMNLYSVNLDDQKILGQNQNNGLSAYMSTLQMPQGGAYSSTLQGMPILHDTVLELTIDKIEPTFINTDTTVDFMLDEDLQPRDKHLLLEKEPNIFEINGKIINPLKVVLSKQIYEQILQTIDNVTYNENEAQFSTATVVLEDISEEKETIEPSVSALKLNDTEKNILSQATASKERVETSEPTVKPDSMVTLKANFKLPILDIEMRGDFGEGEQGLVNIKLHDFLVHFEKSDPCVTLIDVELGTLFMEDLLQDENSEHRQLLASSVSVKHRESCASHAELRPYLSTSCPNSSISAPTPHMPPSLPSSFRRENVFTKQKQKLTSMVHAAVGSHSTPCKRKNDRYTLYK